MQGQMMASSVSSAEADTKATLGQNDSSDPVVLVEKLFPPQPAAPVNATVEESALLPRLLNRTVAMWSGKPEKDLKDEIQALRSQKIAAAQLLDAVEHAAEQVEQRLQEKSRQARAKQGRLAFPWATCANCGQNSDTEEVVVDRFPSNKGKDDVLELRPVLRTHLKEYEQTLVEKDAELRQLKHELNLLRCEKEAARQSEKDSLLDVSATTKETLVRRYAAQLSAMDGSQLQNVFLVWKHYARERAVRSKLLKRTCLALSTQASQYEAMVFSNWNFLVREKRQAELQAKNSRRQAVSRSYAAKLLMRGDSAILRAVVVAWWRCCKESALQSRVESVEKERKAAQQAAQRAAQQAVAAARPAAQGVEHKACCSLM